LFACSPFSALIGRPARLSGAMFSSLLRLPDVNSRNNCRLFDLRETELIEVMCCWGKVRLLDEVLFEAVCNSLSTLFQHKKEDNASPDMIVRFLHSCGKLSYRHVASQVAALELLRLQGAAKLGIVEGLRVATAIERLGLHFPELENYLTETLPGQVKLREAVAWRGRKQGLPIKRRTNPRKLKWSW